MFRSLDLPGSVYDALAQAASASGTTPVGWIVAHLPVTPIEPPASNAKNLAELMADYIGTIASGGNVAYSEDCGEKFTDGLVEKRQQGRL